MADMRVLVYLADRSKRIRTAVTQFVGGPAGRNKPVFTGDDGLVHPSLTGAVPLPGQYGYTRQYRVYADLNNPEARNRRSGGWAAVYLTSDGTINGTPLFKRPMFEMTVNGQYGAQLATSPTDRALAEMRAPRPMIGWMSFDRKAVFVAAVTGGVQEEINNLRNAAQEVPVDVLRNWTGTLRVFEGAIDTDDVSVVSDWDFTRTGGMLVGASVYNVWKHYLPDAYTDSIGVPRAWAQPSQVYVSAGYPARVPSNNVLASNNYAPTVTTGLTRAGDLTSTLTVVDDAAALLADGFKDNSNYDNLLSGSAYRVNATAGTVSQTTTVQMTRAAKQAIPDGGAAVTAKFAAQIMYRSTGGNVLLQTGTGQVGDTPVTIATLPASATWKRVIIENLTPANQATTSLRLSVPVGADFYFIGQQFETHGDADFALAGSIIPTTEGNTVGTLRLPRDISVNHDPKTFRPFEFANTGGSDLIEATVYSEARFQGFTSAKVLLAWFGHNGNLAGGTELPLSVKVFALSAGGKRIEVAVQGQALQAFNLAGNVAVGDVVKTAIAVKPGSISVAVGGAVSTVANSFIGYNADQFEIGHNESGANFNADILRYRLHSRALTIAELSAATS